MLIKFLLEEGRLEKSDMIKLIKKNIILLKKEANVLSLEDPINIVGDIHG